MLTMNMPFRKKAVLDVRVFSGGSGGFKKIGEIFDIIF
jgi:hypothetical protein